MQYQNKSYLLLNTVRCIDRVSRHFPLRFWKERDSSRDTWQHNIEEPVWKHIRRNLCHGSTLLLSPTIATKVQACQEDLWNAIERRRNKRNHVSSERTCRLGPFLEPVARTKQVLYAVCGVSVTDIRSWALNCAAAHLYKYTINIFATVRWGRCEWNVMHLKLSSHIPERVLYPYSF